MIEQSYGCYSVICDSCGESIDGLWDDFQDALDGMKARGWRTSKISSDWINYCPDCYAELNRPTADEFAGIRPAACDCGCRGGRPVPAAELEEIRTKIQIQQYRAVRHGKR